MQIGAADQVVYKECVRSTARLVRHGRGRLNEEREDWLSVEQMKRGQAAMRRRSGFVDKEASFYRTKRAMGN